MRESFQSIILHLVLTGIFFLCVAGLWFLMRRLFQQFRALSRLTRVVVVVMVTVAALLAQKPDGDGDDGDGDGDDDESGNYSLVESTIHAYEPWTIRGAADDWFILNFTNNWVFPHDSDHWTRCVVLTSGQVWDTTRGTNRLVAVGQQMSAVPDESCFTYELTDDNSYLLTWSNFFLNRDTNQPITASIELKRNGDWIATSNEVSFSHSRLLPFAHDGFGQDADWVRANFTNAEEILSVGYADWIDAQVGCNLTNGLYKFVATFEEDPPEIVNLTVGDLSVAVTNAGDYAFLLEKGPTYRVGMSAVVPSVNYWAVDDLGGGAPSFLNMPQTGGDLAHWTSAGGDLESEQDADGLEGTVCWPPLLSVSPDVPRHLWPDEFPLYFTAMLSDLPAGHGAVTYEWQGGNDWLTLTPGSDWLALLPDDAWMVFSPDDSMMMARASLNRDNLPDCGQLSLSVTARFGDKELTSYLTGVTVGTVDPDGLSLSVSAPEVVFLNDDGREGRYYHATVTASCPFATNATVSLTHTGIDGFAAFRDEAGERVVDPCTNVVVSVTADSRVTTHDFWFKCSQIGRGRLEARTVGEGARQTVSKHNYTVIEPIQRLVTTRTGQDDRFVNPSRLIYGTNVWLEVECNGDFSPSAVEWSVLSGPARIVQTTGFTAEVEPTADEGEAVVEARFGHDTAIQPRFVLPIVRPQSVPVRVYCVKNGAGRNPGKFDSFAEHLKTANDIFAQVGISFYQQGASQAIMDASYAVVQSSTVVVSNTPNGVVRTPCLTEQVRSLCRMLPQTNGVNIVYVHGITNSSAFAFALREYKTLVMGDHSSETTLAHELGHILGLDDIYARLKASPLVLMDDYANQPYALVFRDSDHDWTSENKRGFYTTVDTHGCLIERLLMCGHAFPNRGDIPSGSVRGLPPEPRSTGDLIYRRVGANSIRTEGLK